MLKKLSDIDFTNVKITHNYGEIECPLCGEMIFNIPDAKLRHMEKDHNWCGTFCGIFCTPLCSNKCCRCQDYDFVTGEQCVLPPNHRENHDMFWHKMADGTSFGIGYDPNNPW